MSYAEDATCAIRREGDHWRHFHQGGDHPGLFVDADTARSGCNVTPADAVAINQSGRLITMEDVRAAICKRLDAVRKCTNCGQTFAEHSKVDYLCPAEFNGGDDDMSFSTLP